MCGTVIVKNVRDAAAGDCIVSDPHAALRAECCDRSVSYWVLSPSQGRAMCFVILTVEYCAYPVLSTMYHA